MPRDAGSHPDDALEDIAYLSRSGNRIQILDLLSTKPHTLREVREATDASRSTLRRILTELEDRGWAERTTDGEVVATAKGDHVVRTFTPLVEAMQAMRQLDRAVVWLPFDELSVGLHHFSDATVRHADPNSPAAEASYLHDRLRDASAFTNLTHVAPPLPMMETIRDGVVAGRLTARTVLTKGLVEYLLNQREQTSYWRECITAGACVYCYEGPIPCHLYIVDGTVLIGNNQSEAGRPCEFIETADETVLSWAREMIASYRTDAERLTADVFAEYPEVTIEKGE